MKPDSPGQKYGQVFSGLLVLAGVIVLLALGLTHPAVLAQFADDKVLDAGAFEVIRNARRQILVLGLTLTTLGLVTYRWRLLRFLDGRPRAVNAVLLIFFLGLTLALVEVVFQARPIPSREELLSRSVAYDVSPYSIHRLATFDQDVVGANPGTIQTRIRNGYRGSGFLPAKPEHEVRIVILGGSFVFDTVAGLEKDWPHRVEMLLHAAGHTEVRVINAGVPAHSTFDAIGRLCAEIHLYEPDLVAVCHAWNDIKYFNQIDRETTPLRFIRPMAEPTHEDFPPSAVRRAFDRVHLFRILGALPKMFSRFGEEGKLPEGQYSDTVNPIGIEQYTLNLRTLVDISRNIGAEPVLITQPHLPTRGNRNEVVDRIRYDWVLLSHDALCEAFESCERANRRIAEEEDCQIIDLASPLSGREEIFVDHVHLNPTGSEAVAALVARDLLVLLDRPVTQEPGAAQPTVAPGRP